jgi:hypothetical protein
MCCTKDCRYLLSACVTEHLGIHHATSFASLPVYMQYNIAFVQAENVGTWA